jgi:hypothetical protein
MVHAFTVVTVHDINLVPNKGEYRGKIGFLIINSVLVAKTLASVPT